MMMNFTFIAVLSVIVPCVLSAGPSVWEKYEMVMSARLGNTFKSTSTLSDAHKFIKERRDNLISFGCSTYASGAKIADKVREGVWKSSVTPMVVDHDRDYMCFLVVDAGEDISEVFDWTLPALPSLKVHDSMYGFVESPTDDFSFGPSQAMDVTLYFRPEAFNKADPEAPQTHFSEVVKNIAAYGAEPFEQFYWTSSAANRDFQTNSVYSAEYQQDEGRRAIWQDMVRTFQDHVLPHKDRDPCGFEELGSVEVVDGKIVLPVEKLLNLADKQIARACLAYLTATFAGEGAVNHVALTTSIQQTAKVGTLSGAQPYTSMGLKGDGQVVAVADTGLDINSCYFFDPNGHVPYSQITSPVYNSSYRKVIQYTYSSSSDTSDQSGGHGTHVSGITSGCIAGADITTDGMYDGVAPNAKIAFMDLGTPNSGLAIPPANLLYGDGYTAGARVHTNSWGNYFSGSGYYCSNAVDGLLNNNKNFMIFFAAGNAGGQGSGTSTITMDSSGKNMISVGSSETTLDTPNINYVAWYSSKGPVYDNRIKPDLVAPGDQLMSAKASGSSSAQTCDTIEMTGTSMASPSAAGAALLVRQYFMANFWTQKCYPKYRSCKQFTPSGSLTKALLLHSTAPMSLFNGGGSYDVPLGTPPDYMQGFGRIDLDNVLPLTGYNQFDLFVDDLVTVSQNGQINYLVTVPTTKSPIPLKVTLVWYDPPNVDGTTSKALLQNLDVRVLSPTGIQYFPNGLSTTDGLNTVERTIVKAPSPGIWKVMVMAQALPVQGYQQFSLVITSGGKVSYA